MKMVFNLGGATRRGASSPPRQEGDSQASWAMKVMPSPAILKPKELKTETKSPAHSEKRPVGNGSSQTGDAAEPDPFSFLRVFKLADLMMKQGC